MGSDLQMVNQEAFELGSPVPSSPRPQCCGFTVHGSAQTCCEDAWSFMFVLKALTWQLTTPSRPGGGLQGVQSQCSLPGGVHCWDSEPGGPCVTAEGNRASPTPAIPAWMTLIAECATKNRKPALWESAQLRRPEGFKKTCFAHCMDKARISKPVPKGGRGDQPKGGFQKSTHPTPFHSPLPFSKAIHSPVQITLPVPVCACLPGPSIGFWLQTPFYDTAAT